MKSNWSAILITIAKSKGWYQLRPEIFNEIIPVASRIEGQITSNMYAFR
jgi:hypothetical protein